MQLLGRVDGNSTYKVTHGPTVKESVCEDRAACSLARHRRDTFLPSVTEGRSRLHLLMPNCEFWTLGCKTHQKFYESKRSCNSARSRTWTLLM